MPRPDIDLGQLSDPLGSKRATSAFFSPDEIAGIAAFVRKIPKWPVVSLERDWGRLRLTKNGGGRNNSICGNLPSDEHPPFGWSLLIKMITRMILISLPLGTKS